MFCHGFLPPKIQARADHGASSNVSYVVGLPGFAVLFGDPDLVMLRFGTSGTAGGVADGWYVVILTAGLSNPELSMDSRDGSMEASSASNLHMPQPRRSLFIDLKFRRLSSTA